jgi:hypothetical protein
MQSSCVFQTEPGMNVTGNLNSLWGRRERQMHFYFEPLLLAAPPSMSALASCINTWAMIQSTQ